MHIRMCIRRCLPEGGKQQTKTDRQTDYSRRLRQTDRQTDRQITDLVTVPVHAVWAYGGFLSRERRRAQEHFQHNCSKSPHVYLVAAMYVCIYMYACMYVCMYVCVCMCAYVTLPILCFPRIPPTWTLLLAGMFAFMCVHSHLELVS